MNYKINTNNHCECSVESTKDISNGLDIFSTFSKAKKEYLKSLRMERDMWNLEIKLGVNLKKEDVR